MYQGCTFARLAARSGAVRACRGVLGTQPDRTPQAGFFLSSLSLAIRDGVRTRAMASGFVSLCFPVAAVGAFVGQLPAPSGSMAPVARLRTSYRQGRCAPLILRGEAWFRLDTPDLIRQVIAYSCFCAFCWSFCSFRCCFLSAFIRRTLSRCAHLSARRLFLNVHFWR